MPRSPTEFIAVDTGLEVAGQVVALHGSLVFGVAFPQIWFPLGLPQRDPQLQATHAITITQYALRPAPPRWKQPLIGYSEPRG